MDTGRAGEGQAGAEGLAASAKRLLAGAVGILQTRLQLLSSELEEEGVRILQVLLLGAIALVCFAMALVLGSLLVVVLFWDTHRVAAILVLAGLYAGGGLLAVLSLKARARARSRLFAGSLAELRKDHEALGS